MNSKQLMIEVLNGRVGDRVPVTPHWWGLYKFQLGGMISGYEDEGKAWGCTTKQLVEYDELFYNTFKPDMFHLTTGVNKNPFSLAEQAEIKKLREQATSLERVDVDRYLDAIKRSTEQVMQSGELDHISILSQKYGDEVLLTLNEGSDVACFFDSHVGFETGLIGMLEDPDGVAYYLSRLYDNTFERMKALKAKGGHAFINSETYCSADIISPSTYREVIFPIQAEFYKKLSDLSIIPICYFTGDVLPIIEDIKKLPIKGLMVEASKKTFDTDIGKISQALEGEKALFGNLESHYILEVGSKQEVITETLSQLEKTKGRPFIMANDCPISFNTPAENIKAMIDTVRGV